MLLTKEQISEQMCKHAQKKNGLHDLMEIMLESMMGLRNSFFSPISKFQRIVPGIGYPRWMKMPSVTFFRGHNTP